MVVRGLGTFLGGAGQQYFLGVGVGKILWVGVIKHFRRCCDEMYFWGWGGKKLMGWGGKKIIRVGWPKLYGVLWQNILGGVVKSYDDQGVA